MPLDPRWVRTVDDGIRNEQWDEYDALIQREIADYNLQLPAKSTGYVAVDWKIAKAMLWVESGGPSAKTWKGRVLQIGNPGDLGYGVVKNLAEGSEVIVSPALSRERSHSIDDPQRNIRFALAYLFTRMARFAHQSIEDPSAKEQEHTVAAGETMQSIGAKLGTTIECLQRLNPAVRAHLMRPGQKLRWRPARKGFVITGWRRFDAKTVADRYNGDGDENYAEKLEYVLGLFAKLERKP